jgi:hypothetical protein
VPAKRQGEVNAVGWCELGGAGFAVWRLMLPRAGAINRALPIPFPARWQNGAALLGQMVTGIRL